MLLEEAPGQLDGLAHVDSRHADGSSTVARRTLEPGQLLLALRAPAGPEVNDERTLSVGEREGDALTGGVLDQERRRRSTRREQQGQNGKSSPSDHTSPSCCVLWSQVWANGSCTAARSEALRSERPKGSWMRSVGVAYMMAPPLSS